LYYYSAYAVTTSKIWICWSIQIFFTKHRGYWYRHNCWYIHYNISLLYAFILNVLILLTCLWSALDLAARKTSGIFSSENTTFWESFRINCSLSGWRCVSRNAECGTTRDVWCGGQQNTWYWWHCLILNIIWTWNKCLFDAYDMPTAVISWLWRNCKIICLGLEHVYCCLVCSSCDGIRIWIIWTVQLYSPCSMLWAKTCRQHRWDVYCRRHISEEQVYYSMQVLTSTKTYGSCEIPNLYLIEQSIPSYCNTWPILNRVLIEPSNLYRKQSTVKNAMCYNPMVFLLIMRNSNQFCIVSPSQLLLSFCSVIGLFRTLLNSEFSDADSWNGNTSEFAESLIVNNWVVKFGRVQSTVKNGIN
jgi:hypothetical protein